jgi:hypothetical protein
MKHILILLVVVTDILTIVAHCTSVNAIKVNWNYLPL